MPHRLVPGSIALLVGLTVVLFVGLASGSSMGKTKLGRSSRATIAIPQLVSPWDVTAKRGR